MIRKAIALAALLTATLSFAQTRGRAVTAPDALAGFPVPGTTVSGLVTGVSGSIISLANGLVTLDVSAAKILAEDGVEGSLSSITPGSIVFAVLKSGESAPNAPLPAMSIAVTRSAQVTLGGPVQSVDSIGATLTLLGRTIHVTAETSFGGSRGAGGLLDILPNQIVQVQANAVAGSLVATSVLVFAQSPPPSIYFHGTVKSIGTDSWVISNGRGKDVTVVVNAQTKIIGDPKVGDSVDVLINVDSAGANVALSIMKSSPPSTEMHITGTVSSINGTSWTISPGPPGSLTPVFLVQVNAQTKIVGDPKVGDRVEVVAQLTRDGFVAISITKL